MKIVNNVKKEKAYLEVGDIICFQDYGEVEYRLVCKSYKSFVEKYFTINLMNNIVRMEAKSLDELWSSYKKNLDNDLHIIKAKNVKLVIE